MSCFNWRRYSRDLAIEREREARVGTIRKTTSGHHQLANHRKFAHTYIPRPLPGYTQPRGGPGRRGSTPGRNGDASVARLRGLSPRVACRGAAHCRSMLPPQRTTDPFRSKLMNRCTESISFLATSEQRFLFSSLSQTRN